MTLQAGDVITASEAPGYVSESVRSTASASFTSETVLQSVTFTAVSTARYKITASQSVQSTVANDQIIVRIRWSSGASLSTSGTQLLSQLINQDVASKGLFATLIVTVTGLSGQVTVGATAARNAGTGTVSSFGGSTHNNTILVERI